MTDAIATAGLTKRWGKAYGIKDLTLEVPVGSVFGFLGANGAGKTTTIRMLLGLTKPTAGRCWILGKEVPGGRQSVSRQIGASLENPGFYPGMSAYDNLRVLAWTARDYEAASRIDDLLLLLGLAKRAADKVGTFSFGMRQRLALAAALLHDPKVLILDEPAKGLDPEGVHDVRRVIEERKAEGTTVFLSSHLLSEIERVCDAVAVVHRGAVIAQGSLSALQGEGEVVVVVDDSEAATSFLQARSWSVRRDNLALRVGGATAREVAAALAAQGIVPHELRTEARRLEDVFLELTRDEPDSREP
ncbi:MAG TPA: ABC transporter ATP-binding protein [Actinomycetota bacterium]